MEQARHYVCTSCYTPIPVGYKFCGKCGAGSPYEKEEPKVDYFSATQAPGKARLFVLRGRDSEWVSYHLNSRQHVLGRTSGVIVVEDDNWTSPKHACFYYDDEDRLHVRDEGSLNGVFLRVAAPVDVPFGTTIAAGEHVFRIDLPAVANDVAGPDGTFFFHGIWQGGEFRVAEVVEGGETGLAMHARNGSLTLGREDCDMVFPADRHMDLRHIRIDAVDGGCRITDLGTKNGTFVRIGGDTPLAHGDYVLVGRQLLRVEVTP